MNFTNLYSCCCTEEYYKLGRRLPEEEYYKLGRREAEEEYYKLGRRGPEEEYYRLGRREPGPEPVAYIREVRNPFFSSLKSSSKTESKHKGHACTNELA